VWSGHFPVISSPVRRPRQLWSRLWTIRGFANGIVGDGSKFGLPRTYFDQVTRAQGDDAMV